MGTRAIGVGVLAGSIGFGALALRTPEDTPDSHPLPSATAEYSTRPSKRTMPWFGGGGSRSIPEVPAGSEDRSEWLPAIVRVVDLEGRPVEGAEVQVQLDARAHALARVSAEQYDELVIAEEVGAIRISEKPMIVVDRGRTGADGTFTTKLEPHVTASVIARAGNGGEGVSAPVVAIPGTEAAPEVVVEVAPVAVLAGRLEDGDGRGVAYASLAVSMRGHSALATDLFVEPAVTTSIDGTFRVAVRAGGALDLSVNAPGYQPLNVSGLQVLPGRETHRDFTLESAGAIRGRLLDDYGQPVASGRVELHALDTVPPLSSYRSILVDPDGSFSVADIAPASYRLVAYADGFPPVVKEPVVANGSALDVRVEAGGTIKGEVFVPASTFHRIAPYAAPGVESAPMWGMLWVVPVNGAAPVAVSLPSASITIGADGRGAFELANVPSGRWILRAQLMSVATLNQEIYVQPRGSSVVSVTFDDSGAATLAGVVRSTRAPVRGGSIYLQPHEAGAQGASATISGEGAYEVPWVTPGTYTLHASAVLEDGTYETALRTVEVGRGRSSFDVVTDAPTAVVLDTPPQDGSEYYDTFVPDLDVEWNGETMLVSSTKVFDGVRIWAGDRILQVDGTSSDPNGAIMMSLRGRESSLCRLVLERPATGERFTLTLPRTRPEVEYGCRLEARGSWDW